jgi:hypothetical protein
MQDINFYRVLKSIPLYPKSDIDKVLRMQAVVSGMAKIGLPTSTGWLPEIESPYNPESCQRSTSSCTASAAKCISIGQLLIRGSENGRFRG